MDMLNNAYDSDTVETLLRLMLLRFGTIAAGIAIALTVTVLVIRHFAKRGRTLSPKHRDGVHRVIDGRLLRSRLSRRLAHKTWDMIAAQSDVSRHYADTNDSQARPHPLPDSPKAQSDRKQPANDGRETASRKNILLVQTVLLLSIFVGIIPPLIMFLITRKIGTKFSAEASRKALNFHMTIFPFFISNYFLPESISHWFVWIVLIVELLGISIAMLGIARGRRHSYFIAIPFFRKLPRRFSVR